MNHTCTKHAPGSPACYSRDRCRCDPCRAESNRVKKRYVAIGSGLVSTQPVRAHIRHLVDAGHTHGWIAGRIGRAKSYIDYLATTARRMHPTIAQKILAVRADTDGGMVDSAGTRRRIQALAAIGWPTAAIDTRLGHTKGYTHHILGADNVLQSTARTYAALYDTLWDTQPPADTPLQRGVITRTIRWARNNNWPPPAAWDDGHGPHGIDNPNAEPWPDLDSRRGMDDTVDELRLIIGTDNPDNIAQRLGYNAPSSLAKALHRADEHELACRIDRKAA